MLEFTDHGGETLMRYDAVLDPAFPVPKLLGSWLIEKVIGGNMHRTALNLERLCLCGGESPGAAPGPGMRNR